MGEGKEKNNENNKLSNRRPARSISEIKVTKENRKYIKDIIICLLRKRNRNTGEEKNRINTI